ncbi:MAG: hypothetical protein ACK4SY_05475 [Pyrobaculum sp.]
MAQTKSDATKGDLIVDAPDTFRPTVQLKIAYDVVDELASSPEKYLTALYKPTRLAEKVYRQLFGSDYYRVVREFVRLANNPNRVGDSCEVDKVAEVLIGWRRRGGSS